MQGISLASLKKHPSLIPLFVCLGAGALGATLYSLRLATRNPDVTWKRNNPEPWNEWSDKQYKFFSPSGKFTPSQAPNYRDN